MKHVAHLRTGGILMCECCAEDVIEFLSFDHISGGGRKDMTDARGRAAFYRAILRGDRDGEIRILCYNCNCSHGHNGYCPHQI